MEAEYIPDFTGREHDLIPKVNMCGRYFLRLSPEALKKIFGTENPFQFKPVPNATPLQFLPIIVRGAKNSRRAGMARWGLLPAHASHDDKTLSAKLKNARIETVREKISFSDLWNKGRRCLVPASGFYEWPEQKIKGHPGFEISHTDVIGMAGLWNKTDDLVTFTILTRAAAPGLSEIHSRMPVMFDPGAGIRWLEGEDVPHLDKDFQIREAAKPISQSGTPSLF